MDSPLIDGVYLTPLKIIKTNGGSVLHAMKNIDRGFEGFQEAYFSSIDSGTIRAWKKHNEMTLNLIVPIGEIKFVLLDQRNNIDSINFHEIILSRKNYYRLTVPPKIWVGFQGLSKKENILLNLSNLKHNQDESDQKDINEFEYDWSI